MIVYFIVTLIFVDLYHDKVFNWSYTEGAMYVSVRKFWTNSVLIRDGVRDIDVRTCHAWVVPHSSNQSISLMIL